MNRMTIFYANFKWLLCLIILQALGIGGVANITEGQPSPIESASFSEPTNLTQLLSVPAEKLQKVDIGLIDLLCAEGLPGSETLNVSKCVEQLDQWANKVTLETRRYAYRFAQQPELFCNSVGYYRMQMFADVLVNDLRIRYNPQRVQQSKVGVKSIKDEDHFFADSKDIFIHGLITGDHYGTCASMPFLYAAIAQRLGYPITLAATEEHLYVRYDDGPDHLNIESTAVSRFKTPPDEYYRDQCAAENRDERIKNAGWLRPLTKKEVIGHALLARAACLRSAKRYTEEIQTWDVAARYLPDTAIWRQTIELRRREAELNLQNGRLKAERHSAGLLPQHPDVKTTTMENDKS